MLLLTFLCVFLKYVFQEICYGTENLTIMAPWCRGVVVIITAQLHSANPECRLCSCSNPACGVSEICNAENFWQWSWLEIRLDAFRRSTIPQKQFTIHLHHHHHHQFCLSHPQEEEYHLQFKKEPTTCHVFLILTCLWPVKQKICISKRITMNHSLVSIS